EGIYAQVRSTRRLTRRLGRPQSGAGRRTLRTEARRADHQQYGETHTSSIPGGNPGWEQVLQVTAYDRRPPPLRAPVRDGPC
ncbi:MAG: hypothetical protein QGI93_01560, partial [Planctomycetota bacterium]|nr:hypothetical protein [Planctomycetota bacterium]